MENKKILNEIFIMRSVACLTIVFLHVLSRTGVLYEGEISQNLRMLLMFGTPTFIFISELLISKNYGASIPSGFIRKRVGLILIPYIIMAFTYAFFDSIIKNDNDFNAEIFMDIVRNVVFGGWHGYFVLIIFQFYFLHKFLANYLDKKNPLVMIIISFLITTSYLSFFTLTSAPEIPGANYIWARFYWMPFIGWFFYFVLAYYAGKYYNEFIEKIRKNTPLLIIGALFSGTLYLFVHNSGLLFIETSKRPDVLVYATIMILLLLNIGLKFRRTPKFLMWVNNLSFGIYLVHYLFIDSLILLIGDILPPYIFIPFVFLSTLILSMFSVWFINQMKIGKFIVGNINKTNKPKYTNVC